MFCSKCGKELVDGAVICPNCGTATGNFYNISAPALLPAAPEVKRTNGLAIAGMVCAIAGAVGAITIGIWIAIWAGFVGALFFLFLPSFVGLILSIVGMVKVKEYKSGFGCALAGIIIGALSVVAWVALFGFWFVIFCLWVVGF